MKSMSYRNLVHYPVNGPFPRVSSLEPRPCPVSRSCRRARASTTFFLCKWYQAAQEQQILALLETGSVAGLSHVEPAFLLRPHLKHRECRYSPSRMTSRPTPSSRILLSTSALCCPTRDVRARFVGAYLILETKTRPNLLFRHPAGCGCLFLSG